jgi:hypothetical protein
VNGDLGRLQLNVRFAPVNDRERALQAVYSSIVEGFFGKPVDTTKATAAIAELSYSLKADRLNTARDLRSSSRRITFPGSQ